MSPFHDNMTADGDSKDAAVEEEAEDRASGFDQFILGCIPKLAVETTDTLPDFLRDRLLGARSFKVSLATLIGKVKLHL